jgi:hypothetical protein
MDGGDKHRWGSFLYEKNVASVLSELNVVDSNILLLSEERDKLFSRPTTLREAGPGKKQQQPPTTLDNRAR